MQAAAEACRLNKRIFVLHSAEAKVTRHNIGQNRKWAEATFWGSFGAEAELRSVSRSSIYAMAYS